MPTLSTLIERQPRLLVLGVAVAALAVGFGAMPFWDEDEPRFAAIARTMVETGDWVVPMFNGELAVDKPVLMHWCMALGFTLFGFTEFAARLPSAIAALLTALAILRAGSRWFSPATGVTGALAYLGCLLVAIEAHAATPDAILVALTTWGTLLLVEPFLPNSPAAAAVSPDKQPAAEPVVSPLRAGLAGGLFGLAVLCKGPIGFIGPLAVVVGWVGLAGLFHRSPADSTGTLANQAASLLRHLLRTGLPTAWQTLRQLRLLAVSAAMLAVAAPWYVAVGLETDWAWPEGFFLVHNVGRFVAPMERHSGGLLFHPLTLLVGFYPWSSFLPLAVVVAGSRLWQRWRTGETAATGSGHGPAVSGLLLVWMAVWVGGFSLAATKLPNYILPAYPAAALLVAALAIEAASLPRWPFPRWLAVGLGGLAFGGIATAATVLVATFFGLTGGEPAAVLGLIPLAGAAWLGWSARQQPGRAVAGMVVIGLLYSSLAVGPAASWISRANTLPGLLGDAHAHTGGTARIGVYPQLTPNIVYYADGLVRHWRPGETTAAAEFLSSGPDAVVIVPEDRFAELAAWLPEGTGVIGRTRPLFKTRDFLLVGTTGAAAAGPRTATTGSLQR